MLSRSEFLSSLIFFATVYPAVLYTFRDEKANPRQCLWVALTFVVTGLAIKLGYELHGAETNYYGYLEVSRHSSALDIRQAYKRVSKKLHPDKNSAPNAEEQFQRAKTAYDVLMDETQRDVYNRFGREALAFDPRLDELKLLSGIGVVYLFWFVTTFIFTAPKGARAARTWIAIAGIGALVMEVTLCLTDTALPTWLPTTMTEQELIRRVHSVIPAVVAGFTALSLSLYVDMDKTCLAALAELAAHQKALAGLLQQLQGAVAAVGQSKGPTGPAAAPVNVAEVANKMSELRDVMEQSNDATVAVVDKLKNSSSNPGSQYYWLLFVAMYGGMYFFGGE